MRSRTKLNFVIDSVAGILFVLSFFAGDGEAFHIVVTLIFSAVMAVHLSLHWHWISRQTNRLLAKSSRSVPGRVRANLCVDLFILTMFSFALLSGAALMMFPEELAFSRAHGVSSVLFVLGTVIHIVLHRSWIVANVKAIHTTKKSGSHASERRNQIPALRAMSCRGGDDA